MKIIVTVPCDNTNKLREAICQEGAGIIGKYYYCSVTIKCVGSFKPSANATPYIGEKNKIVFVDEEMLEVICDITIAKKVVTKIRKVHPYEEPAIDIIPLISEETFSKTVEERYRS